LKPGRYKLSVKGHKQGDISREVANIASLNLIVETPFHQTIWFFSLLLSAIGFGFYSLYRYRLLQILKLQALRNNISRDLHDEVGSSLSSISMLSASTKLALDNDTERSKMLVDMIGENSQKILEDMDDIVWAVSPSKDSFEHLITRMQGYVNTIGEGHIGKVLFMTTGQLSNIKLSMLARKNIYLIFKEALNNAAKHADAQNIEVKLTKQNSNLIIEINDDGLGFEQMTSKRNGIGNMKSRAIEIGASLTINSDQKGTRICLNLLI
jgi:signal transduction histidine kinase